MTELPSEPAPEDTSTPDAIVDAAYRFISFAAGGTPAWPAFRRLFADRCVLALRVFPTDTEVRIMTLDEYIGVQVTQDMEKRGYTEEPANRETRVLGDIAECRVRFDMVYSATERHRALDIFQLARVGGRWWIVSIVSDMLDARST